MAHSSPGHVKISGAAVLANPRAIDPQKGSRHLAFDANFNIEDGGKKPTLGLLRYFVPDNLVNRIQEIMNGSENFIWTFIVANISSIDPNSKTIANVVTDDLVVEDYAFTGDIKELLLVNDNIDVKHRPYIDILGSVSASNTQKHTFNLEPNQYVALIHNSTPFNAHVYTTDSKRWGDKKPKPPVGTTVMVGGYLNDIKRNADRTVAAYEVELDDITYVGAQANSGSISGSANQKTQRRSKTRFNFDSAANDVSSPITTAASDNAVAESASTSGKKRENGADSLAGLEEKESEGKGKRRKVD